MTHFNLGLLLARTGRLDEAVAAYQRALEREPALSDARSNLATVFARQGRLDRAVEELNRVLAIRPRNALARTNLEIVRDMQAGRVMLLTGLRRQAYNLTTHEKSFSECEIDGRGARRGDACSRGASV